MHPDYIEEYIGSDSWSLKCKYPECKWTYYSAERTENFIEEIGERIEEHKKVHELNKYIGKYVDIIYSDGEGGAGWVKEIREENGTPYIVFDYGFGFPILSEDNIKEVSPPENDSGMFEES